MNATGRLDWNAARRFALMVAVAGGLGLLALPGRARACTFACSGIVNLPHREPHGHPRFPANAVRFRLAPNATPELAASFRLAIHVEGAATRVPASVRTIATPAGTDVLFTPDASLEVGKTYVLEYDSRCPESPASPARPTSEFRFFVDDPVTELPAFTELTLTEEGVRYDRGTRTGFAVFRFGTGQTSLLQAITEYSVELDGYLISKPYAGLPHEFEIPATCQITTFEERDGGSCGGYYIPPGRHRLKVTPRVLGSEVQPPPLTANIDLRGCDIPPPGNPPGCAISPRGPAGGGVLLALLALGALRRRRYRTSHTKP